MSKIKVKLADKGTIFHDASQNATILGSNVVELTPNVKVNQAIKEGRLIDVTKEEAEAEKEAKAKVEAEKEAKAKAEKEAEEKAKLEAEKATKGAEEEAPKKADKTK